MIKHPSEPGRIEFIALMAMLGATIALSIDAMLPVLPDIGAAISPETPDQGKLVVPIFMLGLGLGTLLSGPLADAYGRRPAILWGFALYAVAGTICAVAPNLETMLAARFVQGLGAAGPRVASMAIIRDRFAGREMAQTMSFVMIVFMIVPALAPSIGALIAWAFGWRAIFSTFVVFALGVGGWFFLRQKETLAPDGHVPIQVTVLMRSAREILTQNDVRIAIVAQALVFGMLVLALITIQSVYEVVYERGESFPIWFGFVALVSGLASFTNARLVIRLGMLRLVRAALVALFVAAVAFLAVGLLLQSAPPFALFLVFQITIFASIGFSVGNINAIAMAPLGHIAGFGASFIQASATVIGVLTALAAQGLTHAAPAALAGCVALLAALSLMLVMLLREVPLNTPSNVG